MATKAGVTAMWDDRAALGLTPARVFRYDFEVLEEHRRQMDESLRASMHEADKRWMAVRDHVETQTAVTLWAEEFHEARELLPRLQWNAQLVLAYSTFEHVLNQLCLMAKARTGWHKLLNLQFPSGGRVGELPARVYDDVAELVDPNDGRPLRAREGSGDLCDFTQVASRFEDALVVLGRPAILAEIECAT